MQTKKNADQDRKNRGLTQKIYLIMTHTYNNDVLERSYDVMGTTNNVYNVIVKSQPACTCPDYMNRQRRCKHIYFVLSRIMKVQQDKVDKVEYSDSDLKYMFEHIPYITENLRVNALTAEKYKQLKMNNNGEVSMRKIDDEDECPICLDLFYMNTDDITFCRYSCGNVIHKTCFDRYTTKQTKDCIKCVYCRQPWFKHNSVSSQYINIKV